MMKIYLKILIIASITTLLNASNPKQKAVGVYIVDVKKEIFSDKVEALGTLHANEQVILSSSVTDIVSDIYFEDNMRVKKGDLLLKLDTREEIAQLSEEEATLKEALLQLKRLEPLAKHGAISVSKLDESRMYVDTAKARIKAIKARIELRHIRAPFDGVVGLRDISVGSLVQAGSSITTIDDDSIMKLDFTLSSINMGAIKKGLKIRATSKVYPKEKFEGEISAISSRVDPISRSITVRALIKNDLRILKPGLLMSLEIDVNSREAIVIPEICIVSINRESSVLVVETEADKTTTQKRVISIGTRKKGYVEVTSGLKEGEQIVSHGLVKVKPNQRVLVKGVQTKEDTLDSLLKRSQKDR